MRLAYVVACMPPRQAIVLLCASLYMSSKVVQDLYFKSKMRGSKPKSSSGVAGTVLPRHH